MTIRVWFWVLIAGLLTCAGGCSRDDVAERSPPVAPDVERPVLRYQGFSGMVSYPELAEELGYLAPLRLEYVGNTISGPQDIQTVVTGDVDFGGAFNGAVLKLVAARAPITAVVGMYGVDDNTWSGYFVLETSPIRSARDFIGKKVAVNTIGAHQEFVLREYLSRAGLSRDEIAQVTLVVMPPISNEQALRQGQVDVAVLQSVLRDRALERGGLRNVVSDHDLFGTFTAGSYVMTKSFLRDNPRTARRFVEGTARAIEWARNTPRDQVVARMGELIRRRERNEDATLLQYWRSTGIAGTGGLLGDRDYQLWIDWLIQDGQLQPRQLAPGDVYTNELNPFVKGPA